MPSDSPRTAALRRVATGTGTTLALTAAAVGIGSPASAAAQYTVQRGDTVSAIAARNGVTVASIASANTLADPSYIRIGQVLRIPTTTSSASPTSTATKYTVVKGDTLSRIALRYHTTVGALASANGLKNPSFIRIGQVLTIPAAPTITTVSAVVPAASVATATATTATATATSAAATYTVMQGDTLSAIAAKYCTTVAALQSANGLSGSLIRIGQVLSVPPASTIVTTTSALVSNTFAGRTYAPQVVAAASTNRATLLAMGVPSKAQIQALVASTARSMGVDPALALAISCQESGFDQSAVSSANAIGAMQVIPSSGVWAGTLVGRPLNLLDANDDVTAGVAILRQLIKTSPNLSTAIAGYYQGASSVQKYGMFADTKKYVASVLALIPKFA
ncbi:MAG: LysM peptidoglycan-binding domain-containing protein [Micrococcales bacterium]|nr:LysM peptidoglycan-binding domain-containing protein [Micrococcales bacterium]